MATNPYKTPDAGLVAGVSGKKSIFWWIYFYFYLFIGVASLIIVPLAGIPINLVGVLSFTTDFLAMAGLYGFLRNKSFLIPLVWRILLVIIVGKIVYTSISSFYHFFTWTPRTSESYVTLSIGFSFILALPLIYALWSYSFSVSFKK